MAGGGLVKSYLFVYNSAQALGWAYALGLVAQGMREGGPQRAYAYAGETVCLLQAVSFLETVHAAAGLVRSGVPASLLHWSGRSHALLAVVARFPELQARRPEPRGRLLARTLFGMWRRFRAAVCRQFG